MRTSLTLSSDGSVTRIGYIGASSMLVSATLQRQCSQLQPLIRKMRAVPASDRRWLRPCEAELQRRMPRFACRARTRPASRLFSIVFVCFRMCGGLFGQFRTPKFEGCTVLLEIRGLYCVARHRSAFGSRVVHHLDQIHLEPVRVRSFTALQRAVWKHCLHDSSLGGKYFYDAVSSGERLSLPAFQRCTAAPL